jgi:hypothetical protein
MGRVLRGTTSRGLATATLGFAAMTGLHAQALTPAQNLLNDRFILSGSLFLVGTDTTASLNGQSTTNPAIDFDQTFGRESDASRGRIDAMWRFAPKHSVRFVYFNYKATRTRTIDRDITFGDTTFNAGGNVTAENRFSVYELDYDYAFLKRPDYEVSANLGLHFTDMTLSLAGTGTVTGPGGTTTASGSVSKSSDLPQPLPVIGLRGGWAVAPQVFLDARLQFFKLSVDGYDGHWTNAHVGATWMFTRNFGVGLGYESFNTRLDVSRSNFNGNLKFGYHGLIASITGTF